LEAKWISGILCDSYFGIRHRAKVSAPATGGAYLQLPAALPSCKK